MNLDFREPSCRGLGLLTFLRRCVSRGCVLTAMTACGAQEMPPEVAPAPSATSSELGSPSDVPAAKARGPRPPDFELETLDGSSIRLSEQLGSQVVLLDFWATFCDPCLAAMPHLDELYRRHKDKGLLVLGIAIDGPDSIAQVRTEVAKTGVTFPILLDDESRVLALYNPRTSAPFSVLIGRDGRVITKREGYTTGSAEVLEQDISEALQSK